MHEYRLTEDLSVAGLAATDVAHATAAERDAAGGAVSGQNSSRGDEATNPDTRGPGAKGAAGGAAGGVLASSSNSSPKGFTSDRRTGTAHKINLASWVVVRVLKRSSLTPEEQATVTQQVMAAQHAMVAQQRMTEQQQLGGAPLQGVNPSILVHPQGSGAEQQAVVTGGMGGSNVAVAHRTAHRMGSLSPATGCPMGVTGTVRSNSPSTDSQGDKSPTTLTTSQSPNSSFSAMPVDVRSNDTASQAAGLDTGAAVGAAVAAMASVAMDVAGAGAAVGAAVGARNAHPGPASPLLNLPIPHTGLFPSPFIQPGAGSSRPTMPQGLLTHPLLEHLFLLQQQHGSRATVQQGLLSQQQQSSNPAMQQGSLLQQQNQQNIPALQQELEQVLYHDPSFRQLLLQAESSEPPCSRDGDTLIQVQAEAESFGLWDLMQQGMRTGDEHMTVPGGMTIPPPPGATVLTPANSLLRLPVTSTRIQLQSMPFSRAPPNQQAGFTVASQQQQGHSATQQSGYQQATTGPFSSWSAPPHPFRPTPSASMSASSSGDSQPCTMQRPAVLPTFSAAASVVAAGGASTDPAGAADSAEPGDTAAGQKDHQEMQQLVDLLRSMLGNPVATTEPATATRTSATPATPATRTSATTAAATPVAGVPQLFRDSSSGVVPIASAIQRMAAALNMASSGLLNSTAAGSSRESIGNPFDTPSRAAVAPSSVAAPPNSVVAPQYSIVAPTAGAQQGKRHKGQHKVNVGYQEQQQQQQQQQHDQDSLHEILQQHMPQQQELSPDPSRTRSVSCPAAPLQGANQYVTPFRPTHSYNHPRTLQGAVGVQGEQGRTYMETQSDSLLHTSVWGSGGLEVAGRGKVGEGRSGGGDGGLEEIIRHTSWHGGAGVSGMEQREVNFPGRVGVATAGVAAAGAGAAADAVGAAAAGGAESTSAGVEAAGVGDAAAGASTASGAAAAARGGGDQMASVDGLGISDLEALLMDVEGELGTFSSMVSGFSPHPFSSMVGSAQPTPSGMPISQPPPPLQLQPSVGLATSVEMGPSVALPAQSENSFASEGEAAVDMATYHTSNNTGSGDGMWHRSEGALSLPESFFPSPAVVMTASQTWTNGVAESGEASTAAASASSTAEATAEAGEVGAEAATTGIIANLSGEPQRGNHGSQSARRMHSPKRSREEDC
ncbi:unnamed protein product [Closterium sp. NIES-53]